VRRIAGIELDAASIADWDQDAHPPDSAEQEPSTS
jgi:hypothetical protein